MIRISLILLLGITSFSGFSQNTVGTLSYDESQSYDGYNLIYPHNQSTVYLINNCGEVVHSWSDEDQFRPGNTAYLLENGNLIKTKRGNSPINDPIWAGGGGEFVELRDWDNNLISSYQLNNETARLHHDIAITPDGNVLMVAWELKTNQEAILAGRNPDLLANDVLWSEMILEWDPITDEIVWEWHAWDHLIQDFDSLKANYGNIADHPELIDLNYDEHDGHQDWLHINSIDYNPVLDQIALSIPYFNELWIIDHSTSLEESSSHTGGISGVGGDLLFRWGNPATYRSGSIDDKRLFFQHDVKWIEADTEFGSSKFGEISVYNNRINERYSSIHSLKTEFDFESMSYELTDGVFGPQNFERTIIHPDTIGIAVSTGLSSAQFLPNGNSLTLSGRWGYSYELNAANEIVWEYRVPLRGGSPVEQGTELGINNNITFRIDRYAIHYPAFRDRELTPGNRIELNPNALVCDVISNTEEIEKSIANIKILGNPSDGSVQLNAESDDLIEIFDVSSKNRKRIQVTSGFNIIDLNEFSSGILFIKSSSGDILRFVLL